MDKYLEKLKLVKKQSNTHQTVISVNNIDIGKNFVLMAGPCSVEGTEQMEEIACCVKQHGAHFLRGGAFKPRTSPYDFQGLGQEGLEILKQVKQNCHLPVVTELMDTCNIEAVCKVADIIQVGSRNMKNYSLLKALGHIDKPILLKRGMSATVVEWLNAAEYILAGGNKNVILCERGIRTFETITRNTLDLNAVGVLKEITHLPVFVDPSHGTGKASIVEKMSLAAVMAGADGLLIEVHNHPDCSFSDSGQQITPDRFKTLVEKVRKTVDLRNQISD